MSWGKVGEGRLHTRRKGRLAIVRQPVAALLCAPKSSVHVFMSGTKRGEMPVFRCRKTIIGVMTW
jgi:hypothetical protein